MYVKLLKNYLPHAAIGRAHDVDTLHRLVKMQTRDREELILDVNRFKFKPCKLVLMIPINESFTDIPIIIALIYHKQI